MHSLKVYVDDSVFDKVMHFLKTLPKNKVRVDVEPTVDQKAKRLNSISLKTKGFVLNREEANSR